MVPTPAPTSRIFRGPRLPAAVQASGKPLRNMMVQGTVVDAFLGRQVSHAVVELRKRHGLHPCRRKSVRKHRIFETAFGPGWKLSAAGEGVHAHRFEQASIADQTPDHLHKCCDVARRDQKALPAVGDDLRYGPDSSGDDRQAKGHGLGEYDAVTLVEGRDGQTVAPRQERRQRIVAHRTEHLHTSRAEPFGLPAHPVAVSDIAFETADDGQRSRTRRAAPPGQRSRYEDLFGG